MRITLSVNQSIRSLERDIERTWIDINTNESQTEAEQAHFINRRKSTLHSLLRIAHGNADNIEKTLEDKSIDPNDEAQMDDVKTLYSIAYRYMRLVAKYHLNEQDRYKALLRCVYLASYAHLYDAAVADANELLKSPHFTESDAYQLRHNVHFQLAVINTNDRNF